MTVIHEHDGAAIDRLLGEMRSKVFDSESERKAAVSALAKQRQRSWQSKRKCSFPNCQLAAIPRSHALSRTLMIKPISEAGHVMGLEFDPNTASTRMQKVGVGDASTFPGFCVAHENEFDFEAKGGVSNGGQLQRQLFRNICRHIYFLRHEKRSMDLYIEKLRESVLPKLEKLLRQMVLKSDAGVVSDYVLQELFGNLELMVTQRAENIDFDIEHWFKPHAANFGRCPGEFGFWDELISCPDMAVAIATVALLQDAPRRDDGTPDFAFQYYVSMFPNAGPTLIHLTALEEQKERLVALAEQFSDSTEATRTIEGWLQNADHWYMRPSAWAKTDPEFRKRFLESRAR